MLWMWTCKVLLETPTPTFLLQKRYFTAPDPLTTGCPSTAYYTNHSKVRRGSIIVQCRSAPSHVNDGVIGVGCRTPNWSAVSKNHLPIWQWEQQSGAALLSFVFVAPPFPSEDRVSLDLTTIRSYGHRCTVKCPIQESPTSTLLPAIHRQLQTDAVENVT